ncbi:hypothetical protein GCM10027072_47370 [Streptomyces bullii]
MRQTRAPPVFRNNGRICPVRSSARHQRPAPARTDPPVHKVFPDDESEADEASKGERRFVALDGCGKSRTGTPVRTRNRVPFAAVRWSLHHLPWRPDFGRSGASRVHSSFVRPPRPRAEK